MADTICFQDISRYYASTNVQANDHVSFSIGSGEIHAICGENGAGKTTLMRILFGLEHPDSGTILLDGEAVSLTSPADSIAHGIGMVHQHFMLVPSFSVTENIMLGNEKAKKGFLQKKDERAFVQKLSETFHLPIDAGAIVETLPVGLLQRVEILKMLARNVRIIILDEPTAVLTPQEVGPFLETLKELARSGHTILFISHKLQEVLSVADKITVMRQGKVIGTKLRSETDMEDLAMMMVGRKVVLHVDKKLACPKGNILEADHLSAVNVNGTKLLDDVSFRIRSGEIYGIAGVTGNGQDTLVSCISGLVKPASGEVRLEGASMTKESVRARRHRGMAHVPEDRIAMGLNMQSSVEENILMGYETQEPYCKKGFLHMGQVQSLTEELIKSYSIAGASCDSPVSMLSGGNMQKVVLGRELAGNPKLLIVNQPTRGLDVGSIEFVHKMIIAERDRGVAVLLISVELEEILSLSDRVGVLFSGRLQGELEGDAINEKNIGLFMVGGHV